MAQAVDGMAEEMEAMRRKQQERVERTRTTEDELARLNRKVEKLYVNYTDLVLLCRWLDANAPADKVPELSDPGAWSVGSLMAYVERTRAALELNRH